MWALMLEKSMKMILLEDGNPTHYQAKKIKPILAICLWLQFINILGMTLETDFCTKYWLFVRELDIQIANGLCLCCADCAHI